MSAAAVNDRLPRAALTALVMIAIASFANGFSADAAWFLLLPAAAALVLRSDDASAAFVRRFRLAHRIAFWLAVACAWLGMLRAIPSEGNQRALTVLAGYLESTLAVIFLLRSGAFRVDQTLLPASLAVLVIAGLGRGDYHPRFVVAAGVALFVYAIAEGRVARVKSFAGDGRRWGWHHRELASALAAGVGIVVVASATITFLPWAQREIEKRIWNMRLQPPPPTTGLTDGDTRIGQIEELAQSHDVALRIWSPRAQKLRARVYTQFQSNGWRATPENDEPMLPQAVATSFESAHPEIDTEIFGESFMPKGADLGGLAGPPLVLSRIVVSDLDPGILPTPAETILIRAPGGVPRSTDSGTMLPPEDVRVSRYGTLSRVRAAVGQTRPPTPEETKDALFVPHGIDKRIVALAAEIGRDAHTPQEHVDLTIRYLQREMHYTLSPGHYRTSQPLAEFLFERKAGYCEYFATASTMLLRLQGVPARYVTGFSISEDARVDDHYVVRDEDAHAWTEAYLPGTGWLEVDAVPATELAAMHRRHETDGAIAWERLKTWTIDVVSRLRDGGVRELFRLIFVAIAWLFVWLATTSAGRIAALLLVAIAALVTVRVRRLAALRRANVVVDDRAKLPAPLRAALEALETMWAAHGVPRPASRGLLEHARAVEAHESTRDPASASTHDASTLIDLYYRVAFGGVTLGPEQTVAIDAMRREMSAPRSK